MQGVVVRFGWLFVLLCPNSNAFGSTPIWCHPFLLVSSNLGTFCLLQLSNWSTVWGIPQICIVGASWCRYASLHLFPAASTWNSCREWVFILVNYFTMFVDCPLLLDVQWCHANAWDLCDFAEGKGEGVSVNNCLKSISTTVLAVTRLLCNSQNTVLWTNLQSCLLWKWVPLAIMSWTQAHSSSKARGDGSGGGEEDFHLFWIQNRNPWGILFELPMLVCCQNWSFLEQGFFFLQLLWSSQRQIVVLPGVGCVIYDQINDIHHVPGPYPRKLGSCIGWCRCSIAVMVGLCFLAFRQAFWEGWVVVTTACSPRAICCLARAGIDGTFVVMMASQCAVWCFAKAGTNCTIVAMMACWVAQWIPAWFIPRTWFEAGWWVLSNNGGWEGLGWEFRKRGEHSVQATDSQRCKFSASHTYLIYLPT